MTDTNSGSLEEWKSITSQISSLLEAKFQIKATVVPITKNDNMNKKVDKILESLQQEKPVVIASISNGIPKAISIVEIVKQQMKNRSLNIAQFNNLQSHSSYTNPNIKFSKEKDDEDVSTEIKGRKEYSLPVLHILLGGKDMQGPPEWTKQ
ncbi:predicted protein [Scheffersomyces stipitis CBS 6054]|uniref:DNA/RNA-binding protein Alba-like domain-containing protein n=1 Tax=Scheffersomyces stipitis (strain ATCC 58785 / CBS 6054 / NBRC 10063 / NRRL Y-11545) TaxID=322104 RepID=A3LRK8_PICST|nr:predicted protein [Scheffersomyces stipitis CBS 6054]ABN65756.2 predicted protein [Scheffersomyces stipitis CBS 6054]